MGESRGRAPRTHFLNTTVTAKLCRDLDQAQAQGADVLVIQFMGGRDWVILTHGAPILGPAGSRVLHPQHEE